MPVHVRSSSFVVKAVVLEMRIDTNIDTHTDMKILYYNSMTSGEHVLI